MIFEMGILSTKRVGFLLTLFWLGMLCYIMLPDHIPDFLNLRSKSSKNNPISQAESSLARLHGGANGLNQSLHEVPVVIASDHKNLGGMVALVNSIVSHTKSPVKFYLVVDEESQDHIKQWLTKTKLKSINFVIKVFPESWVEGKIKVRGGRQELGSPLNFARYYIPRMFPDIEKVVYLDNDCIVQGDIQELYQTHIAHKHLAAFSEDCKGMNKRLSRLSNVYAEFLDFKNVHVQKMKMKPTACSFNTGVFVANLTEWRRQNVTAQLEHWMELNTKEEVYGNEKGGGSSQPPMMIVFYQKYSTIDPLWHVRYLGWSSGTSYSQPFVQKARLLHWNGPFKPWGRVGQHLDVWSHYFVPDPTNQFKPVRREE